MAFVVSALAVAAPHANAIGAIGLRCEAEQLTIDLAYVTSYRAGFIPGAAVRDQRLVVPYTAVRSLVRRGPTLYLALDAPVGSPYRRFALAQFTDAPPHTLLGAHRTGLLLRALGWTLPLPVGALAAWVAPSHLLGGPVGVASFAALIALLTFATLRLGEGLITRGGPLSTLRRDAFEDVMNRRLGLIPEPASPEADAATERARIARERILGAVAASRRRLPRPEPPAPGPRRARPAAPATSSRAYAALGAGVVVASAMIALGIGAAKRYAVAVTPPPAAPLLLAGLGESAGAIARTPFTGAAIPSCSCARADSPLWAEPLPSLSVLLIPPPGAERVEPRVDRGLGKYRFEIAAVNNTRETLSDVRIVVTFARRRANGERVGANDRGFYVRRLGPARAVKWQVEGRGTEMRIDVPNLPPLTRGDGRDEPGQTALPALADAFAKLDKANEPIVRAHAAMMLAYLRDPRAEAAAEALEPSTEAEELTRQRVLRAASSAVTCAARTLPGGYDVCVHNGGEAPLGASAIIQELLADHSFGVASPIGAEIPPGEGRRIASRHALPEDLDELIVR